MLPPSELCLTLHGPTAAAHELHTGAEGDFEATMTALRQARAQQRPVVVVSSLTRSNCRSLVELVDRLVAARVVGWAIVWPRMPPDPMAAQSVVPRLGIAVPHALRAAKRAIDRGVPVALVGMPLCTLGPFAARRLPGARPGGVYAEVCSACPARSGCPGIESGYVRRFGASELHAVDAVAATPLSTALAEALLRGIAEHLPDDPSDDDSGDDVSGEPHRGETS